MENCWKLASPRGRKKDLTSASLSLLLIAYENFLFSSSHFRERLIIEISSSISSIFQPSRRRSESLQGNRLNWLSVLSPPFVDWLCHWLIVPLVGHKAPFFLELLHKPTASLNRLKLISLRGRKNQRKTLGKWTNWVINFRLRWVYDGMEPTGEFIYRLVDISVLVSNSR